MYYAGHGIRHDRQDKLYLSTRETDLDELDTTAVPFDYVRDVIERSSAKTRLLILDCCFSGLVLGAMSDSLVDPREIAVTGTTVIASAPRNSISHSPPNERNTAFTGALLALLTNGSPVPGRPLDVSELIGALRAAMSGRGLPLPQTQSGNTSGKLLLRRESAPLGTTKKPESPPVVAEAEVSPSAPATAGLALRKALVHVLVSAGYADHGPGRRLLVREVEDALGRSLDVSRELAGRDQLIEVVGACSRIEHGLPVLAEVFEYLRPGTEESLEVQRLIAPGGSAAPKRPAPPVFGRRPGGGSVLRAKLVDVLVRAGFADDKSLLDLLIAEMREAWDGLAPIAPHMSGRDQLVHLVDSCGRDLRNLWLLADVVEFFRPATEEAARFRALVDAQRS